MLLCLWRRDRLLLTLTVGFVLSLATRSSAAPATPVDRRCHLAPITGRCRAAFHGYYFDRNSGSCKRFTFGGCGGNGRIFYCIEECDLVCVQRKGIEDFADEFERILSANSTEELAADPVDSESAAETTHSAKNRRSVLLKENDKGRSPSLWVNYRPAAEHHRTSQLPRSSGGTQYRSKYICPQQEAYEGDYANGEEQYEQDPVSSSEEEDAPYPPGQ